MYLIDFTLPALAAAGRVISPAEAGEWRGLLGRLGLRQVRDPGAADRAALKIEISFDRCPGGDLRGLFLGIRPFPLNRPVIFSSRTGQATALALTWLEQGGLLAAAAFNGEGALPGLEELWLFLHLSGRARWPEAPAVWPELRKLYQRLAGRSIPATKAVIGPAIFAVESGVHVDGLAKEPSLYEPFPPELVGAERYLVAGRHSSRSSVGRKSRMAGRPCPPEREAELLSLVQALALRRGRSLTDEEFEACLAGLGRRAMSRRTVRLVDTTLRDGEQSPGLAFSPETKVGLALLLEGAGVAQIEAGTPAMGDLEVSAVTAIKERCRRAVISTWNRMKPGDIVASCQCRPDIIHVCLPASERQLRQKLGLSLEEALSRLAECLDLVKSNGFEPSLGLEDVSRASPELLSAIITRLRDFRVERLRLSDTVGVMTPSRFSDLVRHLAPEGFCLEVHAHNDLGLAVANSFCAALAGADYVDTTLRGVGERAGNCAFQSFVRLAATSARLVTAVSQEEAAGVELAAEPLLGRENFFESLLH
ncbi:MAG: hypothetical protein LBP55_07380 [Candidatus Adiutrix sp.]|jgi:homocitrate synthase NifV|nr:hypothetical protein [Candidatus Adiutrix sp.]